MAQMPPFPGKLHPRLSRATRLHPKGGGSPSLAPLASSRSGWRTTPCMPAMTRAGGHSLGTKEKKQLPRKCGTRFLQLSPALQDSRSLATCFWELTHLPRNTPSLLFLKTKPGNIRKSLSLPGTGLHMDTATGDKNARACSHEQRRIHRPF